MGRRILFACVECESALVWPVDAEPRPNTPHIPEASFAEGWDSEGKAVVEMPVSSRWKAKFHPGGAVTCPEGHMVGVRHLNEDAGAAKLSLLRERIVTREMRGRV